MHINEKNVLPTQLKSVKTVTPFKQVKEQTTEVVPPFKENEDTRQSSDSSSSDSESDDQQ